MRLDVIVCAEKDDVFRTSGDIRDWRIGGQQKEQSVMRLSSTIAGALALAIMTSAGPTLAQTTGVSPPDASSRDVPNSGRATMTTPQWNNPSVPLSGPRHPGAVPPPAGGGGGASFSSGSGTGGEDTASNGTAAFQGVPSTPYSGN
jgi:hypothetical protein